MLGLPANPGMSTGSFDSKYAVRVRGTGPLKNFLKTIVESGGPVPLQAKGPVSGTTSVRSAVCSRSPKQAQTERTQCLVGTLLLAVNR